MHWVLRKHYRKVGQLIRQINGKVQIVFQSQNLNSSKAWVAGPRQNCDTLRRLPPKPGGSRGGPSLTLWSARSTGRG